MKKPESRKVMFGGLLLVFIVASVYLLGSSLQAVYSHYRTFLGPVFWLLIPLNGVLITSLGRLLTDRVGAEGPLTELRFVEAAGPSAGLLGTILSLQSGFTGLNLSGTDLDAAIAGIVQTISVSLSTTAYGLILGLAAWALRSCFTPVVEKRRAGIIGGQRPESGPAKEKK